MPYRSLAQEGLFHSKNSPVGPKVVAEFDRATRGKHLPLHAAHGGRVSDVMTNEHLPQGDETQVCPSCGYAFGGEMRGMAPDQEESSPTDDAIGTFAEALQRSGRY